MLGLWGINTEIMVSGKRQYVDFLLMNVNTVKDYCTVRDISVSGYNKIELAAWQYSATKMDLSIFLPFADQNKNLEKYSKHFRQIQHVGSKEIMKKIHD